MPEPNETIDTVEEPTVEITPEVQAVIDQRLADQQTRIKAEMSGLHRKNTDLMKELEAKKKEGMTIEDRVAAIEADRVKAVRRAESVEAFAGAGLSDDWRQIFNIQSPSEQAEALTAKLEDYKREVTSNLASEFSTKPMEDMDSSKRSFSIDELAGKTGDEINKLWEEGRVRSA